MFSSGHMFFVSSWIWKSPNWTDLQAIQPTSFLLCFAGLTYGRVGRHGSYSQDFPQNKALDRCRQREIFVGYSPNQFPRDCEMWQTLAITSSSKQGNYICWSQVEPGKFWANRFVARRDPGACHRILIFRWPCASKYIAFILIMVSTTNFAFDLVLREWSTRSATTLFSHIPLLKMLSSDHAGQ